MSTVRLLWRYRALVAVLVGRELAARYRASTIGYLWSLLNPLLLLGVYSVVFTVVLDARLPGADPYPLFLFAGLLPWLFFSGALLDASITLIDNAPLLAKTVCPPEVFPAVVTTSHLVHHLLALPVLLAALAVAAVLGLHPFPWTVVLVPVALVPWVLTAGGAALGIAALSVHFRDLRDLLANLLNLLFFTSPIIYTLAGIRPEWLRDLLALNPMASLVVVFRSVAFDGRPAPPGVWAVAFAVALASWFLGSALFTRLRETFVEAA